LLVSYLSCTFRCLYAIYFFLEDNELLLDPCYKMYPLYLCCKEEPEETGHDWVMRTLNNRKACYKMFRMTRLVSDCLHETLVDNYELKSTMGMSSIESLAMFLWTVGGP
jgi:hypothetical protein